MLLCNPRDREAAHRAQVANIVAHDPATITCRKCHALGQKGIFDIAPSPVTSIANRKLLEVLS
jgi:hypothetical protein